MSKGEAILPANRQSVPTTSRNCPINGIVRSTIGPRANYWFDFSMKLAEGQASAGRNLDGPGILENVLPHTHATQPKARGKFVKRLRMRPNAGIQVHKFRGEKTVEIP